MPELEDGKYPPKIGARHTEDQQKFLKLVMKKRNMSQSQVILSGTPAIEMLHIIYEMLDEFISNIPRLSPSRDTLGHVGTQEKKFELLGPQRATAGHREGKG